MSESEERRRRSHRPRPDGTGQGPGAEPSSTEADPNVAGDEAAPVPDDAPAAPDERYLRLAADFENFKRRKNQELADRSRYASEDAARALLPVLDNLQRALAHAGESSPEDLVNGLGLVVREFENALGRLGVTPIDTVGQPFDPALHEALGGEESDAVSVDTVDSELQRGYRLHDRVLRPALVRVAHPRAGADRG
jgi:molecular chaperone GrpE